MTDFSFVCSFCGEHHQGLPDVAHTAPTGWTDDLAANDPKANRLDTDLCMIGGERFFIRCVLLIPIQELEDRFGWGVWMSQSQPDFREYVRTFEDGPERGTVGHLSNRLAGYPDTFGLPALARWQPNRQRPLVELEPTSHPLYRDWRDGITRERAIELYERTRHPPLN